MSICCQFFYIEFSFHLNWKYFSGPDGGTVHSGERESNGKYTFAAHLDGLYKYCFSNKVLTCPYFTINL